MAKNLLEELLSEEEPIGSFVPKRRPRQAKFPTRLGGATVSREPETASFTKAFAGGVDQMQALGYGAGAVAAELVGAEGVKESMVQGMLRNQEEGEKAMEGLITNWEDVTDLSTFGDYMVNGLGQLTPSILETTIGAIAGAAIGTAVAPGAGTITGGLAGLGSRTAIKKALAQYIAKRGMKDAVGKEVIVKKAAERAIQSFYAKAGAAATGYQIGVGDVYSETTAAKDPQAGLAAMLGVPYAALDFIMPAGIINKFASAATKGGAFSAAGKQAATSAITEATTELGQEELLIQTRRALDPGYDPTGEEAESRRLNAFILGGLGGAAVGAPTGAITSVGKKTPTPEIVTDPATGQELQNKEINKVHKRISQLESMREGWETGKHPVEKLNKHIDSLLAGLEKDFINNEEASAVDKSEAESIYNFWKSESGARRHTRMAAGAEEIDEIKDISPERRKTLKAEAKEARERLVEKKKKEVELRKVQRESDKKLSDARKAFHKKKDRRRGLKGIEVTEVPGVVEEIDIPSNVEEIEILALPEVADITNEVEEITGKRISPDRFKFLKEETDRLKQQVAVAEPVLEGELIPAEKEDLTFIGRIPTTVDGEVVPEYKQLFEDQKEKEAFEITLQRLDSQVAEIKDTLPAEVVEEKVIPEEIIVTKSGKPFKSERIAKAQLKRKGLGEEYVVIPHEGGFAITKKEIAPEAPEKPSPDTFFSIDRETYDLVQSLREKLKTGSHEDVLKAVSIIKSSLNMTLGDFVNITTAIDADLIFLEENIEPAVQEAKSNIVQESDEADVVALEGERDEASFGRPTTSRIEVSEDIAEKEAKLKADKVIAENNSENVTEEQEYEIGSLQYKKQIIEDNIILLEEAGKDTTKLENQLGVINREIRRKDLTKDQVKEDKELVKEIKDLEKEPDIEDDGIEFSIGPSISEPTVVPFWAKKKTKRKALIDNFARNIPESANIEIHYIENIDEIEYKSIRDHLKEREDLPDGLHVSETSSINPTGKTLVYIVGKMGKNLHEIERTMFHEVVGHYGLRKVFNTEWNGFLERMIKVPRYSTYAYALREQWTTIDLSVKEGEETVTFNFGGKEVITSKDGMTRLMNEYLAKRAEDFADPKFRELHKKEWSFFKRVINHIRHVLRKAGFGRIVGEIKDADITALIGESFVRITGEGQPTTTATQKQLAEAMTTDPEIQFQEAVDEAVEQGTTEEEVLETLKLSRTPFGQLKQATHKKLYDRLERRIKAHPWMRGMMPLRDLPYEKLYDILSSNGLGSHFKVTQTTKKLSKLYKNLNSAQRVQIYEYFTTKDANINLIQAPQDVRDASQEAKKMIEDWGQYFADRGLLNESVFEENRGSYLPRRYLKYMNQYVGTGKKTSLLTYLKEQTDMPPEYDVILGRIKDPEFLVIETVGTMGRDVALLQMFDAISKASGELDSSWVLGDGEFVKYRGSNGKVRNISFDELNERMGILDTQLRDPNRYFKDDPGALKFAEEESERLVDAKRIASAEFKTRVEAIIKKYGGPSIDISVDDFLTENYKKIPKDKRWGKLSGAYVRKEIYSDLVDSVVPFNASGDDILSKIVAPRGLLERGTGLWKQMKVPFNIPSWFRNFYGNWTLLDISTDTNSLSLSKMLIEEINNFAHEKPSKYWTWAEDHGLFGTTYAAQELFLELNQYKSHIRRAQLEINKESKNPLKKFLPAFHEKYSWLSEFTGEWFGIFEGWFKTVRLRDHIQQWEKQNNTKIESLPKIERDAVIDEGVVEANKAIFNYSKVPAWLRVARRTPLGSPFITFTYKSFPRTIEAVAKRPQKFIKYAVLPYLLLQAWQQENDLSDEDAEEIRKKMPLWMQEKNSMYILPWKLDGKWQPVDFGYFFPWEPFVNRVLHEKREFTARDPADLATSVGGAAWRTFSDTYGFLGGPVPSTLTAMRTNIDDFTNRPIVTEGAPANQQVLESLGFLYTEVAPSWLTSHGFLGKVLDHYNEEVNEFGTRTTTPSVLGRAVGFNIYPTSEKESHIRNLKTFKVQESKILRARSKMRKDRNLRGLEKAQKMREFNELLKHQRSRRTKYLKGEY